MIIFFFQNVLIADYKQNGIMIKQRDLNFKILFQGLTKTVLLNYSKNVTYRFLRKLNLNTY